MSAELIRLPWRGGWLFRDGGQVHYFTRDRLSLCRQARADADYRASTPLRMFCTPVCRTCRVIRDEAPSRPAA